MRSMPLLIVAFAALGSCSTTPEMMRADNARSEAKLQQALLGKVAGKPVDCLPARGGDDMIRIDDDTILFRRGPNRVYRNELNGQCNGLGSPHYALVTRTFGGGRLCRGDIARVVDLNSGMHVGSCAMGAFVPYSRPRA